MMNAEVEKGLAQVCEHFADHTVDVEPDGQGGVFVTVHNVSVGGAYVPAETWLGFHISAAYPHADVYPHFIGVVQRADGAGHGPAVQHVDWRGRQALQLSRRSNRWNPAVDNVALKAEKVIAWFFTK